MSRLCKWLICCLFCVKASAFVPQRPSPRHHEMPGHREMQRHREMRMQARDEAKKNNAEAQKSAKNLFDHVEFADLTKQKNEITELSIPESTS